MALSDIVRRIGGDATDEAAALVAEAASQADALLGAARDEANRSRTAVLEAARAGAAAEAETVRAAARLAARDNALAAKRKLIDLVLERAQDEIVGLGDAEYASFVARSIVAVARGGERVLVAPADAGRLAGRLPHAVAAAAHAAGVAVPPLAWTGDPAPVDHGVVLAGDRVSVDLSIDAIVGERADELAMLAAARLFDGAGA